MPSQAILQRDHAVPMFPVIFLLPCYIRVKRASDLLFLALYDVDLHDLTLDTKHAFDLYYCLLKILIQGFHTAAKILSVLMIF